MIYRVSINMRIKVQKERIVNFKKVHLHYKLNKMNNKDNKDNKDNRNNNNNSNKDNNKKKIID